MKTNPMVMRLSKYLVVAVMLFIACVGMLNAQTVDFYKTNITCYGDNDGTITITVTAGSSSYEYVRYKVLDPADIETFGPTTDLSHNFTDLSMGDYVAYVRDLATTNDPIYGILSIAQPLPLDADLSKTNVTCFGGLTGAITISNPEGGSGQWDYTINGGTTWFPIGNFAGLTAGTYNVQIRDRNNQGCIKILNSNYQITQPDELTGSLSVTNVSCFGKGDGSIAINGADGGTPPYQYSKNGGILWQPGNSFSPLVPGTYNVVMRDASGCTLSFGNVPITQPAVLTVTDISVTKGLTCNEGSDGRLTAVVTGGTPNYTYDWYVNNSGSWVTINQHTQTAENLPQGWYEVRVNDANGCGTAIPPTAREFFRLGAYPGTDTIPRVFNFDGAAVESTCAGQTNGSIDISASGGVKPYRFSITTGGNSGYQADSLFSNLAAGVYQTWAMDKKGCKKQGPSQTVVSTPNEPVSVTITANPTGSICPGTSVLFTAVPVNGGTAPVYQWFLNGAPVGSGGPTYTNSTLVNGNQVRVRLTSNLRCTTGNPAISNTITAALKINTAINTQPQPVTACVGLSATFTVGAVGTNLNYQWRKNGTNIPGATSSSYTIPAIAAADAGNYSVVVSGDCGPNITSNAAALVVNPATAINTQPQPVTACVGAPATFTVGAVGTNLKYQWRKNGTNISTATGASYTIPAIAAADAGNYSVVVSGDCGPNITSNAVALVVNPATAINSQPQPVTACAGLSATFTVGAVGTNLKYQWRKNGTNIPDATSSSYTIPAIAAADAGNYSVVVSGDCGPNITSNAAALVVNPATAINTQPQPVTACVGAPATFTVGAVGTNLKYQWRKNGTNISTATGSSYTIAAIVAADAGNYSVVVSGDCGPNITSNAIALVVNPATAINSQPQPVTACAGLSATFTVGAVGTNLKYQWRKNGTNISTATGSSYTIPAIAAADAGNYSVVVSGDCGPNITSNAVALVVNPATAINTQPQPVTACVGAPATFTVGAVGTNLKYQWRKNGTNISTATGSSYTIAAIAAADAGNYSVVVSGDCGPNITSNAVALVVNPATAINTQPQPVTACAGSPATFTVVAVGTNLKYQWRKNGTNILTATGASYTIPAIAAADAGNYSVVVSGDCGPNITSNAVALVVNPATAINTQPQPVTACVGAPATFTVGAVGTNLKYQWRKNGTDIPTATGSSYTIAAIAAADAGNYSVVVSGDCGPNITSNAVALVVNPATAINTQPQPVTACAGLSATFTVGAVGTNLKYQWRKNGTDIPTANGSSYTIAAIAAADAGNYSVVVSGDCGPNITSNAVALVVNPTTAINTQPQPVTACVGSPATFTVVAVGTNLKYQWRKNGTNISTATGSSYTIAAIVAADAGNYSVVVSGDCGPNITSNAVALVVNPATAINSQPQPVTACAGLSATFTVGAVGTNLKYQWRKNGTNILTATGSSYTIPAIVATDAGNYSVVVSGDCGPNITSNAVALVVNPATAINTQPLPVTACAGTPATFTVVAVGTNLNYHWKKNGTDIPSPTGSSYTIPAVAVADAGNYSVVVTGECGEVTSNVVSLTVNEAPAITIQPVGITECPGNNVTFTVTADGLNLTYLWRRNAIPLSPAQTGASLTLNAIDAADAGNYDVIVTNSCGTVTSSAATLIVAILPGITSHPFDQEVCEGSDVTFSVSADGTGITYQWRRDGFNLAGETSSTLALNDVTTGQSGVIDVLVYGLCDTLTSDPASLVVNPATAVVAIDNDTIVCEGSTVELKLTAVGQGIITYQWQRKLASGWFDIYDLGDFSGTSTSDLKIENAEVADTGYYRCFISADCGSIYSDSIKLEVNRIIATIGTPAPFLIDSTSTKIRVAVRITDRYLNWDLGVALVAPDGTEIMLKGPLSFPCVFNPIGNGIDVAFSNNPALAEDDTIDYCLNTKLITGTYNATGNWNKLHGKDPANGAWTIRIYDNDKSVADPDGYLKYAALTFADLDAGNDSAYVIYNSGAINMEILNPVASELRATSYILPMHLMTSCFNTQDAQAIVTVQGGIAPYTYQWTGPTAVPDDDDVMLGPGTYSVLVTDALGCSAIATVDVTSPPVIDFDDVRHTATISCFGAAEGIIRSKASGGSGSFIYTLMPDNIPSAVADSGVFFNLAAGTYTIRATDINGCSLDSTVIIAQRPELTVQIDIVPVTGPSTGSITLTASGGTPPYQYSIDNGTTLQATGQFDNLAAGIYPVYVVDANGCTFTQDVNLSVQALGVDITKHDVSCGGLADGSFYLAATDGVGPYTLTASWLTTPQTSANGLFPFTGQTAGSYDVKVEDSQGWIFTATIEIAEPDGITAMAVITDAHCGNTPDGAIDLTVAGGTGTYTFDWDDGPDTEDRLSIIAGIYHVTISDGTDCPVQYDFSVPSLITSPYVDAGIDTSICPGAVFRLNGSEGADSVHWGTVLPDLTFIDDFKTSNPRVAPTISNTYVYTVYVDGCSNSDTKEVVVDILPDLKILIINEESDLEGDTVAYLIEGETVPLTAYVELIPVFDLQWSPVTYIEFLDTLNMMVNITPPESDYFIVTGKSRLGCPVSASIHLVVARSLKIYSGFSPNGDAYNDTWRIEHAIEYGDRIHVRVYNRWGEPVFESKGYGGSQEWDGTRNGRPMPVGAYYYIVDILDGKSKPYTGTVTILR